MAAVLLLGLYYNGDGEQQHWNITIESYSHYMVTL